MLEMDLFWTPAVGQPIEDDLDHLDVRAINPGDASVIQADMWVRSHGHRGGSWPDQGALGGPRRQMAFSRPRDRIDQFTRSGRGSSGERRQTVMMLRGNRLTLDRSAPASQLGW